MSPACSPALHRHEPTPARCEGCGSTRDVKLEHLKAGGCYAICDPCYERGRNGWYRSDTKRERIAAVARIGGSVVTASAPRQPALNDPIVLDGTKYRMKSIGAGGWILVRDRWTKAERSVRADRLTWDRVAGVWRVVA